MEFSWFGEAISEEKWLRSIYGITLVSRWWSGSVLGVSLESTLGSVSRTTFGPTLETIIGGTTLGPTFETIGSRCISAHESTFELTFKTE